MREDVPTGAVCGQEVEAFDAKASSAPSGLMVGSCEIPSGSSPAAVTLARSVTPARTSRTKMSVVPSPSPGTRLAANDAKATQRPSSETPGSWFPLR